MSEEAKENKGGVVETVHEGIPSIRKVLKKYIEDGFFWLITALGLTLALPFHWLTSVPAVICGVIAVYASIQATRARQRKQRRRKFRWVATIAILVAVLWSMLGPILIAQPTLYVVIHEDWNPVKSSFERVVVAGRVQGGLFIAADPVRKTVFPVIGRFFKSVRLTKMESGADGAYARMPSLEKLTWTEDVPGLGRRECLDAVTIVNASRLRVSITGKTEVEVAFGPVLPTFVYAESIIAPGIAPWHGILLGQKPERLAFRYLMMLDLSLRAMMDGQDNQAWLLLQETLKIGPPHELERARILTMEAKYASKTSTGNIGGLQALGYARPAMDLLIKHTQAGRTFASPLSAWIKSSLIDVFASYGDSLKTDIKPLIELNINPLTEDRAGAFNKKLDEWRSLPTETLNERLVSKQIHKAADVVRVRDILVERVFKDYFSQLFKFINGRAEPASGWDSFASSLRSMIQVFATVSSVGREADAPGFADWMQPTIGWVTGLAEIAKTNTNDRAIEEFFASCPNTGMQKTFRSLLGSSGTNKDFSLLSLFTSGDPGRRWWEQKYQEWVFSATIQIVFGEKGEDSPLGSPEKLRLLIQQYPLVKLAHDTNGDGELYLPGMFLACLVNKQLQTEDRNEQVKKFEEFSGLDFKKFRDSFWE